MTLANELAYCSLTELTRKISERELSPVEVIDAYIDRVETRNPSLNAFVYQDFERAREEAQTAEKQLMAGDALGPLHGIPVAIKDLFSSKPGTPMTMGGVRSLKDNITQHRCIFTERIEQAGAIVIGKTNSPIMGFRGTCDNYLFGPSRNPFCPDKNTGGSSGGAAATVADGMLPLAEGTDGGGSIRIPASWCGVYGYKAAYGRVPSLSRPNAFASDTPFSFSGPITRTVEDAALALNALAGYHPRDPYSIDDDADFLPSVKRSIRDWKIAYSPNFDVFPVDPQVSRIIDAQVKAFEEEGAHVEEVKLGIGRPQGELSDLWCRLIIPRNITSLDAAKASGVDLLGDHHQDFPAEYLRWIAVGQHLSAVDFYKDQEIRTEIYDAIQSVLNDYDLLVTPTLACLPVDNANDGNTLGPSEINGEQVDPLIGWCLTYLLNFTGHPAASIPAGLSEEGLPVGMQIIGRRYADAEVLAASAAFERLRPWQESYRQCAERVL
jgi:amidase/aspartyl-tRNA(Asn)/glutamyl-tRNA(Gln) amidotransferase subunit A